MLAKVTIRQEALPVVRSSIALKRQMLDLNLRSYRSLLAEFKKQHRMTSQQFEIRFNAGELGSTPTSRKSDYHRATVESRSKQANNELRRRRCPLFS